MTENFFLENTLFGVPYLRYAVFFLLALSLIFFLYWFGKMLIISLRAFVYGHFVLVTQAVDGDTFRCKPIFTNRRKKKSLTVRLIGLDTPESVKSPKKDIAPHGIESSDFSKKRLKKGKFLILLQDVDTIDHYGRELCYAYTFFGEFYNATLIRKGFAWAYRYPPNVRFAQYFDELANVLSQKYKKSAEYKKFVEKYGKPQQLG
jgi:micrococcal nuclease